MSLPRKWQTINLNKGTLVLGIERREFKSIERTGISKNEK
jgi:hypothetical protein